MTTLASRVSPSATQMIRNEHAAIVAQYRKFGGAHTTMVRQAAARTACTALEIHARVKDELFYPALRLAGASPGLLENHQPEHEQMQRLIVRVRTAGDMASLSEAMDALMNAVMHHVADEETRLLPAAEQLCTPQHLAELGLQMTRRRLELARPHAGELAADAARAAPATTALITVGALAAGVWLWSSLRHRSNGAGDMAHRVADQLRDAAHRAVH